MEKKSVPCVEMATLGGYHGEQGYLRLMKDIIDTGETREDRTGTGTVSLFGRQLHFDLRNSTIPMVTTRFTSFRIVATELLWFLRGSTDARELHASNVHIWDGNSSRTFLDKRGLVDLPQGDIGAGYGFQWRHFGAPYKTCEGDYSGQGVDQLEEVVRLIKEDPTSRRICMTAWNPAALDSMALPPCHSCFVQFFVSPQTQEISCHMYQRSVDCFLGLAVNIPSYALLTHLIAKKCGLKAKSLTISTGDTHVYSNHVEQVLSQVARDPLPSPNLIVGDEVVEKNWNELTLDDFTLLGYVSHPSIAAPMAV